MPETARAWLDRLAGRYRDAESYQDAGQLRFRLVLDGEPIDETVNFSVAYQRPGKLRLHVYQANVVVDGKQLRATVAEPELQGQVLELPTPETLTMDALLADELLRGVLTEGIAGGAPQLSLLLTDEVIAAFLENASEPKLLPPAEFEGHPCARVEIARPDGTLVAWIDRATYELRRLDYPVEGLRGEYAKQGKVSELALWAEFSGAGLNATIDPLAFTFEVPDEARIVRRLTPLQPPQAPSALLGKKAGEFEFIDLDGQPVSRQSLEGKVVVLDLWATWCQPCLESLPNLQKVYERFRDNDRVLILAVDVDAPEVTNAQVKEVFTRLGLSIPIVRDPKLHSRDVLSVEGIPNLLVLGPDGVIEDNEIGFNPNLPEQLPGRIERLLAGESLHGEALARYESRKQEYEHTLSQVQELEPGNADGIPRAKLAPASQPERLILEKLWTAEGLSQPGNVLVVRQPDGAVRLLVVDGWKMIAEVSPTGKVMATHDLKLPEGQVASFLRTAADDAGKRYYLAAASNQPQGHLYDEQFQLLWSFPALSESAEVMDAQLADLDGDGRPEACLGYWGVVGVQAVSLAGERLWQNRSLENVTRLAVSSADPTGQRRVFCAHGGGTIVPIDCQGAQGDPIVVPDRFVRSIVTEDLAGDGQTDLCGIALTAAGTDVAVGIRPQGGELWHCLLPAGVHEQPVEMVTAGQLFEMPVAQWIVAGSDGSIYVISSEGQLLDRFNYGQRLSGLAVVRDGQQTLLIVASGEGLDGWRVTPRQLQ